MTLIICTCRWDIVYCRECLIQDDYTFKKRLNEYNLKDGPEYELILSMGMANYDPEHRCSVDELLMRADDLMYKDKKKHKRLLNKGSAINKNQ